MKNLRVGVVGLGPHFKETLLPALIGQEGITLKAFCDQDVVAREWVRARFPDALIVWHVSSADFWRSIDCVICCSWPVVHEQVLNLAIDYQKHCLCEKPAVSSASALSQILKKHLSTDLVIRVGQTFRYMGGSARFIEIVRSNELVCLEVTYLGSGPIGSRWKMSPRKSFSLTHLTHAIDFVTASAGRILEVQNPAWSASAGTDLVAVSFKAERCPLVGLFATNAATSFTCKATGVLSGGALVHLDSLRDISSK